MDIKLGDLVYVATYGMKQKQIQCPHCLGTKYCTVIMATGETFTVDCGSCYRGFEGSTGTITDYDFTPEVKQVTVDKINITQDGIEYYGGCYIYDHSKVFLNEDDAKKEAETLAEKHRIEQADEINRKEKAARSWAWNASYHKQCISRAEKDIAYHTAKLDAAKRNKKA